MKCYALFTDFENFYYNGGFYIGFITLVINTVLIFVFCFKTMNNIKKDLHDNMPTKDKLEEIYRTKMKHKNINNYKNLIYNNFNVINNSNPPIKNKKINAKNLPIFSSNQKKETKNVFHEQNNNLKKIDINNNLGEIIKRNQLKQKNLRLYKKTFSKILNYNNNFIINEEQDKEGKISNSKLKLRKSLYKTNQSKTFKALSLSYKKKTSNSQKENEDIFIKSDNQIENDEELNIDLNFPHLIDIDDEPIGKKELNEIPYQKALRIDKRNFFEIALTVFMNKVGILNLIFYRSPYSYFSLTVTVYLFELLLDLAMNCFLYSDDVVSEKYHNDGSLTILTSFSLSIISNIISSIITAIISNLTDFSEIIEAIIINVKYQKKYLENVIRLMKFIRIRLTIFYTLQILFIILMTYYLFIFSAVYRHSQVSIIINYIIGAVTSLAISTGLSIIIAILRIISIKYKSYRLFNTSKFLYTKF